MSEFIDEDVFGGCTKSPVTTEMSSRPRDLANLGLVYSKSSEVNEMARWIWELSSSQSLPKNSENVDLVGLYLS
jgi:hypothetical protein